MVSIHRMGARSNAGVVAVSVAIAALLSGCSIFGHRDEPATPAPVAAAPAQAAAAPEEELTATETATETAAAPAESASAGQTIAIRPDAPKSYTVQRGDTLWGVSSKFLKDPWLWPEVWIINPQVQNPHLIYPGDTLALAYGANGQPQIRLTSGGAARLNPRLRSDPLEGAIPTIPYAAIKAFLSKPSVLTKDQIKKAPSVLAFREKHVIGGASNDIYVRDLNAPEGARYSVIHVGEALKDPDNGDLLGYEGIYTATASVTNSTNPQKAVLSDSSRETLIGDKLITTDTETPLNFIISSPPANTQGRIINVVDGTDLIGQYQIVTINRGSRHGIVAGNVMAINQQGDLVTDHGDRGFVSKVGFGKKIRLPEERAGTLLIFRTFDRLSYGLVVGASSEIHVSDYVRNP